MGGRGAEEAAEAPALTGDRGEGGGRAPAEVRPLLCTLPWLLLLPPPAPPPPPPPPPPWVKMLIAVATMAAASPVVAGKSMVLVD
jgi:hypothetical protein